ncbi:hypothetical protein OG410_22805 [Streptomyces sp. NBC_00659]|uniref:hypothetical protein n=1 Tax=Streptomyces sp. NBC_00659 TaxID=2903669 RepID=UPI002E35548E|nr:hypothetical protein [Streptomyces sp. NBC_00659]
MKKATYMALAELCGPHLLRAVPYELSPTPELMPDASCAVYIAIDARGGVCYVGSVCRPGNNQGLASHVKEYLHNLPKTDKWSGVYIVLLRPDTPEPEVRRIGGDVAGWLLPYDRERWPRAS